MSAKPNKNIVIVLRSPPLGELIISAHLQQKMYYLTKICFCCSGRQGCTLGAQVTPENSIWCHEHSLVWALPRVRQFTGYVMPGGTALGRAELI